MSNDLHLIPTPSINVCEEVSLLLPAVAMGAATPEERAFVEANISACPDAEAMLASYTPLVEALRGEVATAEPPVALRGKLAAALAQHAIDQQLDTSMRVIRSTEPTNPTATPIRTASVQESATTAPTMTRWLRQYGFWAAILALVALNVYLSSRVSDLTQQNVLLTALNQAQNSALERVSLPGARTTELSGSGAGTVLALWSPQGDQGVVVARDMFVLSPDRVYQFWLIEGENAPVSGGTFTVDSQGDGTLFFDAPAEVENYGTLAISVEPAGGSDAPTTTPVFTSTI